MQLSTIRNSNWIEKKAYLLNSLLLQRRLLKRFAVAMKEWRLKQLMIGFSICWGKIVFVCLAEILYCLKILSYCTTWMVFISFRFLFIYFGMFFPGSFTGFKVFFFFNKIKNNNNNDHRWFINFGLDQFIPTGPIMVLIRALFYFFFFFFFFWGRRPILLE